MKLTKRELPWHHWFAWRPVEDWETGQWYWLETVWRKYRVDGAGARWYYKPVLSAAQIAEREAREQEMVARFQRPYAAPIEAAMTERFDRRVLDEFNPDSTPKP